MRIQKTLRAVLVAATCLGVAAPQMVLAAKPAVQTIEGIPVYQQVDDVVLQQGGVLKGAIVDVNGKPVVSAPIAVGQSGTVVGEFTTDAEGRFEVAGLKSGTYQVASFAGVQTYRVWEAGSVAPSQAKQGVIHVLPEGVARGQGGRSQLVRILTNPVVLTLGVAAAIGGGIALANDDDAS